MGNHLCLYKQTPFESSYPWLVDQRRLVGMQAQRFCSVRNVTGVDLGLYGEGSSKI